MRRNLFFVLTSNIINVIIGVLIGLVLPTILTKEGFGYYRLFILYSGYVGFFHFGFIDGIYLKYGSYNYEDINKETFRKYTFYLIVQQMFFTLIFIIVSMFIYSGDREFVFVQVAINLFLLNMINYYNFLSQIFENFRFNSLLSILIRILNIIIVLLFILFKSDSYRMMSIIITLLNTTSLVISIIYYRKITFGKKEPLRTNKGDIKELYKIGFPLMIGNFIGMVVAGLDAFVVDQLFEIELYSTYSFAISMTSLLLIFVSSFASVLYPYLARIKKDKYQEFYSKLANLSTFSTTIFLAAFFVLKYIIEHYIPKYNDSIIVFVIILPAVIIKGFISIVTTNYFKILKLQKRYLVNNVIALVISAVVFTIALLIDRSLVTVAIAFLISHLLWYFYCDYFFSKIYKQRYLKRFIYLIVIFGLYFISVQFNNYIGLGMYVISYILTTILFFKNEIKTIIKEKRLI